jgi:integrase
MAKKANGEGSVQKYYQNGVFKGWRGRISVGYNDNGELKRKTFYGKTKQEVLKKMTEYRYKQNIGQLPADDKITLAEWFRTWLFEFRKHDLKPSSFERYESIYRIYIADTPVGNTRLAELRASHIQNHFNNLLENGKSASVVHNVYKFLNTCLNEAVKQGYIPVNYCQSVKLPKLTKSNDEDSKGIVAFTLEEQTKFLKMLQGHKHETAITLTLGTGLRLGEMLALKWSDIDFTNNTLHVSRSIKWVTFISDDGKRQCKLIEQTPKTNSSIRAIPIPENIAAKLKQHRKKQLEVKMKNREFYNDNDYLFCDKFGNPLDTKKIPRAFKTVLKKAGIRDMKFHSLRHTYATRLFEVGVPIKTVQALLGHTDITTTMNIYTHVMPEQMDMAADKINALFGQ